MVAPPSLKEFLKVKETTTMAKVKCEEKRKQLRAANLAAAKLLLLGISTVSTSYSTKVIKDDWNGK